MTDPLTAGTDLALFPLNTVLFPGGLLPLRIFETRYVDMVGSCMRSQSAFGVVMIDQGTEVGTAVSTATIGTSARIVDFQTLEDGLLGLLCQGEQRFRIMRRTLQSDGLNRASVEWLQDAPQTTLDPQYLPLAQLLRQVMGRLSNVKRFIEPRYDDAAWVSHRLAEFLPLEPAAQQRLLEMDDPNGRLELLAPLIETP
jgi:hypothetical protein